MENDFCEIPALLKGILAKKPNIFKSRGKSIQHTMMSHESLIQCHLYHFACDVGGITYPSEMIPYIFDPIPCIIVSLLEGCEMKPSIFL